MAELERQVREAMRNQYWGLWFHGEYLHKLDTRPTLHTSPHCDALRTAVNVNQRLEAIKMCGTCGMESKRRGTAVLNDMRYAHIED